MDTMEPVLPGQPGFPAWVRVSLSILLFRPPPAGTRPRTGGIHPVAGAMHIAGVPLPPPPSQDQTGASAVPAAARAGLTSRQAEAFTAADLGADVDLQAARHRVLAVWALSAPRWPPAERLRVALAASSDPHHKTKGLATSLLKQLPPLFLASPATAAELHRALLGTAQASDQSVGGVPLPSLAPSAVAVHDPAHACPPSPLPSRAAALALAPRCRAACAPPALPALLAACMNELGLLGPTAGPWALPTTGNPSHLGEAARTLTYLLRNAQNTDVVPSAPAVLEGLMLLLSTQDAAGEDEETPSPMPRAAALTTVREHAYSALASLCLKAPGVVLAGHHSGGVPSKRGPVDAALRVPRFLFERLAGEAPEQRVSVAEALSAAGNMLRNCSPDLAEPLNALLIQQALSPDLRCRRAALQWAVSVFPFGDVRARFVCCALAGDPAREIATAAKHGLNPFGKAGLVMGVDVESAAAAASRGVDTMDPTAAQASSSVVQVAVRAVCAAVPPAERASGVQADSDSDEELYAEPGANPLPGSGSASEPAAAAPLTAAARADSPFAVTAPLYPSFPSLMAFLTSPLQETILASTGLRAAPAPPGALRSAHPSPSSAAAAAAQARADASAGGPQGSLQEALLGEEEGGTAASSPKRPRTEPSSRKARVLSALGGSVLSLLPASGLATVLRFAITCLHASAITARQDVVSFCSEAGPVGPALQGLCECIDWAVSCDASAAGASEALGAGLSALVSLLATSPAVFAPMYAGPEDLAWLTRQLAAGDPAVRASAAQALAVVSFSLPIGPETGALLPGRTAATAPVTLLLLLTRLVLGLGSPGARHAIKHLEARHGALLALSLTLAAFAGVQARGRVRPGPLAQLRPLLQSGTAAVLLCLEADQASLVQAAAHGLTAIARQGPLPLPLTADAGAPCTRGLVDRLTGLLQGKAGAAERASSSLGGAGDASPSASAPTARGRGSGAGPAAVALGAVAASLAWTPPDPTHPVAASELRSEAVQALLNTPAMASEGLLLTVGEALAEACLGQRAQLGRRVEARPQLEGTEVAQPHLQVQEAGPSPHMPRDAGDDARQVALVVESVHARLVLSSRSKDRRAGAAWLLALLQACPSHPALQPHLLTMHHSFLRVLGDREELARDIGARGLALVYDAATPAGGEEAEGPQTPLQEKMIAALLETMQGKARRVGTPATAAEAAAAASQAPDGPSPSSPQATGGSLALSAGGGASFKALCEVANDAGQPDLVYHFLALAGQQASIHARGAAGAGIEALLRSTARRALMPHLRAILPTIFRFCFDPLPSVRGPMRRLWKLVGGASKEVMADNAPRLLGECLAGMTRGAWREREGAYAALADLLSAGQPALRAALLGEGHVAMPAAASGAPAEGAAAPTAGLLLTDVWHAVLHGMDDVHENVRRAAELALKPLSSVTLGLCRVREEAEPSAEPPAHSSALTADEDGPGVPSDDVGDEESAEQAFAAVLHFMLHSPWAVTSSVKSVRAATLLFVQRLVRGAGTSMGRFVPILLGAALDGIASSESTELSYLQSHANAAGAAHGRSLPTGDALEKMRIAATAASPLWPLVDSCLECLQQLPPDQLQPASDAGEAQSLLSQVASVMRQRLSPSTNFLTRGACLKVLASLASTLPTASIQGFAAGMLAALEPNLEALRPSLRTLAAACAAHLFSVAPLGSAQAFVMRVLVMASLEDEAARLTAGTVVKSIACGSSLMKDRLARYSRTTVPAAFIASHDPDDAVKQVWGEVWAATSTSTHATVSLFLQDILQACIPRLAAKAWSVRQQASKALLVALQQVLDPPQNLHTLIFPASPMLSTLKPPTDIGQPEKQESIGLPWLAAQLRRCGALSERVAGGQTQAAESSTGGMSAGLFGQQPVPHAASGPGLFGQTVPAASASLFGGAPPTAGLFGQQAVPASSPAPLFGQAAATQSTSMHSSSAKAEQTTTLGSAAPPPGRTTPRSLVPDLRQALSSLPVHDPVRSSACRGGPAHAFVAGGPWLRGASALAQVSLPQPPAPEEGEAHQRAAQSALLAACPPGLLPLASVLQDGMTGRVWHGKEGFIVAGTLFFLAIIDLAGEKQAAANDLIQLLAEQLRKPSATPAFCLSMLHCLALTLLQVGQHASRDAAWLVGRVIVEHVAGFVGHAAFDRSEHCAAFAQALGCDPGAQDAIRPPAQSEDRASKAKSRSFVGGAGADTHISSKRQAQRAAAERAALALEGVPAVLATLATLHESGHSPDYLSALAAFYKAGSAGHLTGSETMHPRLVAQLCLAEALAFAAADAQNALNLAPPLLEMAVDLLLASDSVQQQQARPAAYALHHLLHRLQVAHVATVDTSGDDQGVILPPSLKARVQDATEALSADPVCKQYLAGALQALPDQSK